MTIRIEMEKKKKHTQTGDLEEQFTEMTIK